MSVYCYMHMSAGACKVQKRVSESLELGFQIVVRLLCVLGTEPGSSGAAVSALNY